MMNHLRSVTWSPALLATLVVTLAKVSSSDNVPGKLIAGYQAYSNMEGNPIDLDQREIINQLSLGTDDAFQRAENIYMRGMHSAPYARLVLETPLTKDVLPTSSAATRDKLPSLRIIGMNADQRAVYGTVQSSTLKRGKTTLYVDYQEGDSPCHVGGHFEPNTTNCFAPTGGLILEDYGAIDYHYDIDEDNGYWSTLFGFSEHEAEKMLHCKGKCPYPEYEHFYHYYGQLDYGHQWILAALHGTATELQKAKFDHGNEDFNLLNHKGRAAAIQTATVTMNVFTQVNRIMTEWSVEKCNVECPNGNACPEAAEGWDLAVATYAGSLESTEGTKDAGYLYYNLVETLARDFDAVESKTDRSTVNAEVISLFQSGRFNLEVGNCREASKIQYRVVDLMRVPWIQGVLRSAYRLKYVVPGDQEERGRGAAFAASLLPDLYSCSSTDASVVYENLKIHSVGGIPNFEDVRNSLERNYECLQVTCEQVGGLLDTLHGEYYAGAHPCGRKGGRPTRMNPSSQSVGGDRFFAAFIACNVAVICVMIIARTRLLSIVSSQADFLFSGHGRRRALRRDHQLSDPLFLNMNAFNIGDDCESSTSYHVINDSDENSVVRQNASNPLDE